ncbi:hypothetical protein BDR22DRAFT_819848 [Usnea florida]
MDIANAKRNENEPLVDIVAVHGLDENLAEAWTDPNANNLWLRDLLPEILNAARVLAFGYNADFKFFYGHRSADRIQQHAQNLVADLQADRALEDFSLILCWEELESGEGNRRGVIVEESSAAPLISNTERSGIHAYHLDMIRSSDRNTSSYRTVIEALVGYNHTAPSIIYRRWQSAIAALARARSEEASEHSGVAFDIHKDNRFFQYQQTRNRHFHIPQAVSSFFTGREDISQTVEDALLAPEYTQPGRQQRNIIVHGMGGSGKSQFCSKSAQDHQEKSAGFAKIGKEGGMEATLDADLPALFPEGNRGRILVTTRNPNRAVHDTVGAIDFRGLKLRDASVLLLKAAVIPKP